MNLSKYLQSAHAEATELALKLHSDEVTLEHLTCALLSDEESAICELVEHAFADPETLYEDALALTPGILVVGSGPHAPSACARSKPLAEQSSSHKARV